VTQREINAGFAAVRQFVDAHVPLMFRNKITDQHCIDLAIAVLRAREHIHEIAERNKKDH
jgi:hypothetical protein